jgi:hypothetical protein
VAWASIALAAAGALSPGLDPAWITAALALGAAVCGCVAFCVRWSWRLLMRVVRLLDDYFGEPGREGVPARPGVMARLASVEKSLEHVVQETSPNHGKSIRDLVIRTADDVAEIREEQVRVRSDLADLHRTRGEG